ncbi:MAG: nucleoside-triphosphatase [Candidatus Natronoplasma sp.]
MKNNIFITGPPRSGKSTLVREILEEMDLEAEGLRTPDIREGGERKGFKLVDIDSCEEGILAHVNVEEGPRVSRYRVNMDDLKRFTEKSLADVSEDCDIVVIDEIGTMELYSDYFVEKMVELLDSEKSVLAVLHRNQVNKYGHKGELFDLEKEDYESTKKGIKDILKDY